MIQAAVKGEAAPGPGWLGFPPRGRWPRLATVAWLVVVGGLAVAVSAELAAFSHGRGHPWACVAAAALTAGPLLFLGRAPLVTWRLMTLGLAGVLLVNGPSGSWPWSPTGLALYAIVLVIVAERAQPSLVTGVWLWSVLAVWVSSRGISQWLVAALAAALGGLVVLGNVQRGRDAARQQLAQTSAELDAESAQKAVLAERARIARELHDVVAHHMSLIAIQAEAAAVREPDLPQSTLRSLNLIRDAAREALAETRGIVGLLRGGEATAEREPAPGIGQIEALVSGARTSGVAVTLELSGVQPGLPAATELTAYRIVQEALANAARHAPDAPVQVSVSQAAGALTVEVRNGPPGAGPPNPTTPPGPGLPTVTPAAPSPDASARPTGGQAAAPTPTAPSAGSIGGTP
ncbi:MAG: histidine kinase [Bifidobacteriaceae bacterium]|nr:histidine kinase [Bifidobacteriaceae bacterium]